MRTLAVDIETYSDIDIKKGVYRYVDSPDFGVLLFAYAYDNEPVQIIDLFTDVLPEQIISDLCDENIVKTAYNAQFELTCLSKHLEIDLKASQWRCTMVDAYNLSFSGSLKNICEILNITDDSTKLSTGTALIRYFCVPCKPTKVNGGRIRNLPEHSPEKWEMFKEYCKRDVVAERAVRNKIAWFKQCDSEHDLWTVDQKINRRGARIDENFVDACIALDNEERDTNMKVLTSLTGLTNPNSATQFLGWLSFKLGYPVKSVDKEHLEILLNEVEDKKVLEVLKFKKLISKSSTAKYVALKESTCSDGRLRGTLQFYGASRTGRWAGRIFQPQNLPKNFITDLQDARDLVMDKNRDAIKMFYEQIPDTLSQLIRTAVIPSEGKRFIVSDFSAIEARVISWLADEKWRMEVFATHGKIYEASASQMFHVPLEEITKGSPLRARGKVSELACLEGNTEVLTSNGIKKIKDVKSTDLVWDGIEFVNHDGVVYRGKKEVITYDGLTATPDHIVWVGHDRKTTFGDAERKRTPLYRPEDPWKDIWKRDNSKSGKGVQRKMESHICDCGMQCLSSNKMVRSRELEKRKHNRLQEMRFTEEKGPCMVVQESNSSETKMCKCERQRIQELRCQRNRVQIQQRERSLRMGAEKRKPEKRIRTGSHRQQRTLRTWEYKIHREIFESIEPKDNSVEELGPRRVAICKKCSKEKIERREDKRGYISRRKGVCNTKEEKLEEHRIETDVYDILNCGPRNRFIANGALVHNCGYGGGTAALIRMGALREGVPEEELQGLIDAWRAKNPNIKKLWKTMENAAKKCIKEKIPVKVDKGVCFYFEKGCLIMELPNKRKLCYVSAKVEPHPEYSGDQIVYSGMNQYTRKWGKQTTYGGKLVENCIQAIARDCLAEGIMNLDREGYDIVLHVHDEVVVESDKEEMDKVNALLEAPIAWAPGLLLRADGYYCDFYMKD